VTLGAGIGWSAAGAEKERDPEKPRLRGPSPIIAGRRWWRRPTPRPIRRSKPGHPPCRQRRGEPAGFVIRLENGYTIYHAGDTNVFGDMRFIGELYRPNLALLPIGGHFTMGPREAALAVELLGVNAVAPIHWGTFPILAGTPDQLRTGLDTRGLGHVTVHAWAPGEPARLSHTGRRARGQGGVADSVPRCEHAPRGASSGRPRCGNLYSGKRDDPTCRHHRGRLGMSPPVVPGNRGRTEPSPSEASAAPAAPDIFRPRDPAPLVGAPEHADAQARRSLAAARGRLARLVPGRSARTGARQAAEFDAAARKAYQSALKLEIGAPLAPALPAARSAGAPTTEPPTALASEPTAPDAASATGLEPAAAPATAAEPAAAARTSAWATPPRLPAEQSAAVGGEPPAAPPAPSTLPRRRQPGETAPDFLLRTPTNVAPVADDFFDGLIRRVEGDR
jgi:Beta-lactamase superfamily domain